jgi:hypothetical protein
MRFEGINASWDDESETLNSTTTRPSAQAGLCNLAQLGRDGSACFAADESRLRFPFFLPPLALLGSEEPDDAPS